MSVRYYDWIAHYGRRNPGKIALVDLASGRRFSYGDLDQSISRLAAPSTRYAKVARGDRVAVLALNTTDTMEVQFACFRLGAVFLPLNNRLTVPELQFIVGDAAPKVMIHDADLAETALTVAKLCNVASALKFGAGGSYEAASRQQSRSTGSRASRSMTSRPSCTPRARRVCRRAPSSPTA